MKRHTERLECLQIAPVSRYRRVRRRQRLTLRRYSIPGPIELSDEASRKGGPLLPRDLTRIPQVLYANATPPMPHTGADFIPIFGDAIRMTRYALCPAFAPAPLTARRTPPERSCRPRRASRSSSQALAPSAGTRYACRTRSAPPAADRRGDSPRQVAANLIEPGEDALLLNCGYFGDSFADW